MKDETKRETVNMNDGITSPRPLPCHTEPYRNVYNKFGELMNPITKNNPYFVRQKRRIPKTRNIARNGQYTQYIPTFYDTARGKELQERDVVYRVIDSKPYPIDENIKFTGWKRIIHDINKKF